MLLGGQGIRLFEGSILCSGASDNNINNAIFFGHSGIERPMGCWIIDLGQFNKVMPSGVARKISRRGTKPSRGGGKNFEI